MTRAEPCPVDAAIEGLGFSDDAFEQGRLARSVRSDEGHELAAADDPVEVMNGGMSVIAQGKIVEPQDRRYLASRFNGYQTRAQPRIAAQSSPAIARASARRTTTLDLKSDRLRRITRLSVPGRWVSWEIILVGLRGLDQ